MSDTIQRLPTMLLRRSGLGALRDPAGLFGRSAPLVVEIGFGDGRFLVHLARQHPEWNLLGIEISLASLSRAFRRLRRERLERICLLRENARFVVRDMLPPAGIRRVYVNFPDPWPRSRQLSNRLLNADFFRLVSTRLEDGGDLLLTTDHEEYFAFACAEARSTGLYDLSEAAPPDGTLDTKYALKWQAEDRNIQHVSMRLVRRDSAAHLPHITQETMQHVLLAGSLSDVGPFTKTVHRFAGGTVIITEAFRSLEERGLLFIVISEEEDLRQELLVKAWPKKDGIHVTLMPFGDPLGTRGAGEAVRAVSEWLEGQGLERVKSWI